MLEKKLINLFEKHVLNQYGLDTDFYKVYSAYTKAGQPDLIVNFKGNSRTYFVEVKRDTSSVLAEKSLRASQRGRIRQITRSGKIVFLLYDGGCSAYSYEKDKWIVKKDSTKFSAFDAWVKLTRGPEMNFTMLSDMEEIYNGSK